MPCLDDAARDYGRVSLDDEGIVTVHLLLYGVDRQAPSLADARDWAEHFGLDERPNNIVLVGDQRMLGSATLRMIPGLQVVDRNFELRYDSAGNASPHDLWTETWPGVKSLL